MKPIVTRSAEIHHIVFRSTKKSWMTFTNDWKNDIGTLLVNEKRLQSLTWNAFPFKRHFLTIKMEER
jgi:hypothetical protein